MPRLYRKAWNRVPLKAVSESDDNLVCFCNAVTRGELLKAIREGAVTLSQIQDQTLASTGCGGCECDVLQMLEDELKRQAQAEADATVAAANRGKASGE